MGEVYSLNLVPREARDDSVNYNSIANANINKGINAFESALIDYDNDFDTYMQNISEARYR